MKMRNITEIGGLIQQRRTDLGLTQAQVAGRASVSRDWIISIEKGRRLTVDFERLLRTLDVLGLTIEISATEGRQSDADRAVLDRISRAQFTDLARLRNEIAHSPSLTELRERVAGLIDPKVIVSDETREALLVALRTAQPETSDGKSDGDS
ncbi:MAG: hypothetical protein DRJ50_13590 [Actinobacteria bacterium]|nr:MAG: hypothetical protein DRJ50_13590 [Actinomycetota bacterium]